VYVTSVRVESDPDDFTPGIDRAGGLQKQSGGSGDETVEVDERSVLAHEGGLGGFNHFGMVIVNIAGIKSPLREAIEGSLF
jgi:hypothetical protein